MKRKESIRHFVGRHFFTPGFPAPLQPTPGLTEPLNSGSLGIPQKNKFKAVIVAVEVPHGRIDAQSVRLLQRDHLADGELLGHRCTEPAFAEGAATAWDGQEWAAVALQNGGDGTIHRVALIAPLNRISLYGYVHHVCSSNRK